MRRERGSVAVELAIVAPALMLLVLGVLQFGLWYHAQNVVETAALEGARAALPRPSRTAEDRGATASVPRGRGSPQPPMVPSSAAAIGEESARVRVTAELSGLLPIPGLGSFSLSSEATVFRERFRPAEAQ
jgi:Flp pilus assembly protein TadG